MPTEVKCKTPFIRECSSSLATKQAYWH